MQRIIALVFGVFLALAPLQGAFAGVKATFPKRANYFLSWELNESQARELAKWDLVILDMEQTVRNPELVREIKKRNPEIVLLAYITAQDLHMQAGRLGAIAPLRNELASRIPAQWYLKKSNGTQITWWFNSWLLNATDSAPQVNGERWNDFLPRFVSEKILLSGLWDGVFYDNTWDNFSYFVGTEVDLNGDGAPESREVVDQSFRAGITKIVERTRALAGREIIVAGNGGGVFYPALNSMMFENFPVYGWAGAMRGYREIESQSRAPAFGLIQSNTGNTGNDRDYARMRLGLTSTLLEDGYYAFDFGDRDHGQTWWYDEYEAYLGSPTGEAAHVGNGSREYRAHGAWRREFSQGVVLANPTDHAIEVDLGAEFEKLRGVQDPAVNDGLIVSAVTLPPGDGLILRRPIETLAGIAYRNGAFARVWNAAGRAVRNGFFAYEPRVRGGLDVVVNDLDRDGIEEIITAQGPRVRVLEADGRERVAFFPYGPGVKGNLEMAVGDFDGDGVRELIFGTRKGNRPEIKVFDSRGNEKASFFAFGKKLKSGVHVAAGDIDGDGRAEIIVGAGFGGAPEVKIFGLDGKEKKKAFLAYARGMRAGVTVAAGDIDGDGRSEIVTGAGVGGGPQVRIFDVAGKARGGFFAGKKSARAGVRVASRDLDGDGRAEIITLSTDVFTTAARDVRAAGE